MTVANSGGASGYAFDSVGSSYIPTYSNTVTQSGSLSYSFGNTNSYFTWSVSQKVNYWVRSWFYVNTISNAAWLHELNVGSVYARNGLSGSKINVYAGAGAQTSGSVTLSNNTWYRLETEFVWATNQVVSRVYDNTGNLLDTVTSITSTTQWTTPTNVEIAYTGASGTCYQDNLAASDQGWIGSNTSFILSKANNAEGGTPATTLTVANSGVGGDAVDGLAGTTTFDILYAYSGSLSYRFTVIGSNVWNMPGTLSVAYARAYVYFTSLAAAQSCLFDFYGDGQTHAASLNYFSSTGKWAIALNGTAQTNGTTTPVIGTWYRVELQVTYGATTAQAVARIYDASGTLLETITSPATGTLAVPVNLKWGQIAGYTPSYWLDNVALSDQGWLGPVADRSAVGVVAASASQAPAGVTLNNNAEGGSNGSTVTGGNSGGASGDSLSPGVTGSSTITYDNSQVYDGSLSINCTTSVSLAYVLWNTPSHPSVLYNRVYIRFSTVVSTSFFSMVGGAGGNFGIQLSAGKLKAWNGTSNTGTYTYSANTWYRFEGQFTAGSSSVLTVRSYDTSNNLLETVTSPVVASSGSYFLSVYFGSGNNNSTLTVWIDDLAVSDQGWIGAGRALTPPMVSIGVTGAVASSASTAPAGTVSITFTGQTAVSSSAIADGVVGISVVGVTSASVSLAVPGIVGINRRKTAWLSVMR